MRRMPLHLITARAALAGAATNGFELLNHEVRQ
jgi:hypothetical protein